MSESFMQQNEDAETSSNANARGYTRLRIAQTEWRKLLTMEGHITRESTVNREIFLTQANQRTNVQWGDSLEEKGDDTFRVYCANVNGFTLDRMGGQYDIFCRTIKEVQADVACGQEHNLDSTKSQVRSILHHTTQQHWQRSRVDFSTTPIEFQRMYKPGGTFLLTVGDATGRVRDRYRDKWGRWTSQSFLGGAGCVITIVSAYQVVTDSPAPGLITAASQQYSLLLQTQDAITNPRQAFRRDLQNFLQECQKSGHELLLVGDFNEEIGQEADGMISVLQTIGMVDVMRHQHNFQLPATYARGSRCLDYVFATPKVAESVRKSGYEAFNARFATDHRSYFIDMSVRALFGITIQPLSKLEPRILCSNNRQQVTAYIQQKYKILEDHNVFRRIDQLTLLGNRHAYAERLDRAVVEASLAAEKSIRRFGTPSWSIALHKARQRVQVLTKCLSMAKTRLNNEALIRVAWDKAGFDNEPPTTERQCTRQLKDARKEVRAIIAESFERREQERLKRIKELEASASRSDNEQAISLRQLQKAEALNRLFSKLRRLQITTERSGVSRIEIPVHPDQDPKACSEWKQIDVPTEVLEHLRQRNRKHFGQADGTPFTVPPLRDQLGYCGNGPAALPILQGQYQYPPAMDPHVRQLLQHLQISDELSQLRVYPTINEMDYVGKLKAWRESTVTSPSKMHLGHYKAMIAKHSYSSIPEDESEEHRSKREELNFMQSEILRVHLTLMNYALERGYSFERWRNVANSVLFKDPGSIRIHRTRIIHIYEADYNLMLGLKWRSALLQAEALEQLNSGQYGSRPKRTALDPVFLEEMQLEMSRITRKTMILTNYDATACYDRIIPNLAMLASRKFGVHEQTTLSNVCTLERAEYRIRTDLGMAPEGYHHTPEYPIYGTGQGSGNSPAIWCFISSILYDCYDEIAHKAHYCSPDRVRTTQLGMIGFVDDSNGQTNSFDLPETSITPLQVLSKMKDNATQWSKLLAVSGGALELSKCSYHVLTWKFTASGAPVLYNDPSSFGGVHVPDALLGEALALQYLSTYEAHKTLGHYKEPAGTQRVQFQKLLQKSRELTAFMWSTHLTREEAWTFYFATYLPSMSYPLANSHFTERQLTMIQKKAMLIMFAKCGYNRNTKREILFGPLELGGANFRRLYDQQGIGQIRMVLRHLRSNTPVGDMLRIVLEWCQYAVGTSSLILDNVHIPLPHLEAKWIASLRTYLASVNARLQVDSVRAPPLEREHDEYIMDIVLHSGMFSAKDIRRINYCRLYLQVVTLSDLATTDGEYLDMSKLAGKPSLQSSRTRWIHIHQDQPSLPTWNIWKKANRLWSSSTGKLFVPLGSWLHSHRDQRMESFAYGYRNRVAVRVADGFVECELMPNGNFRETQTYVMSRQIPSSALPISVQQLAVNQWEVVRRTSIKIIPPRPIPRTFEQFIEALDPWEVDLLRHTQMSLDPREAVLELQEGFCAGSDGSEKFGNQGAFGWIISTLAGERIASGKGPSRGATIDSYRAECSGMLAIMRFLIRLAEYTDMFGDWTGTIGTDSKSLLDRLFGKWNDKQAPPEYVVQRLQHLDVLVPEWDLLIEIQSAFRRLPEIRLQHVKGHQDKKVAYNRLSLIAQMNVDADELASQYQAQFGMSRPRVILSPNAAAHLEINEGTVTAKYDSFIRNAATAPGLREYIKTKNGWSESIIQSINWMAHSKAMKSSITRRVHFSKLVHDCLPTNSMKNRFDSGKRKCPVCPCDHETRDHILRCPAADRVAWRQTFMVKIDNFHEQEHTCPLLRHLLREALQQWFQSEEDINVSPIFYPNDIREVIDQQNRIGWRQLYNGRFGTAWSSKQEAFYRQTANASQGKKQQRTGARWQRLLILLIWDCWLQLWKTRNEDVHGSDKRTQAAAERREVSSRLEEIYIQRSQLEPSVQQLLLPELQDHVQRPTWVNQNWLAVNASIFRDSLRRARLQATNGVRSIRSYFPPIGQI